MSMPDTVYGIRQQPLSGKSFLASFTDPTFKGRTEQYFEILSNRSTYGRLEGQRTAHAPLAAKPRPGPLGRRQWELYNLNLDFSEPTPAAKMPKKLAEMKARFDAAAQEYDVYPLDDRGSARLTVPEPPCPARRRTRSACVLSGATRISQRTRPRR